MPQYHARTGQLLREMVRCISINLLSSATVACGTSHVRVVFRLTRDIEVHYSLVAPATEKFLAPAAPYSLPLQIRRPARCFSRPPNTELQTISVPPFGI